LELDSYIDGELDKLEDSNKGEKAIEQARRLLPIVYDELMEMIGGGVTTTFDLSRTNKSTQDMVNYLQKSNVSNLGEAVTSLVAVSVYSELLNKFRPYIVDNKVAKKSQEVPTSIMINLFAPSGDGKDGALTSGRTALKEAYDLVQDKLIEEAQNKAKAITIKQDIKNKRKEGIDEADIEGSDEGWEKNYREPSKGVVKMANYQSLTAEADLIQKNSIGNIFLQISEFGSSLSTKQDLEDIMVLVGELYDIGVAPEDLKKTKELKTSAIDGIAISCLVHSSLTPILNNAKAKEKLLNFYGMFLGRRTFTGVTTLTDSTEGLTLESSVSEIILNEDSKSNEVDSLLDEIGSYGVNSVSRLINNINLRRLSLSDKARDLYVIYKKINRVYRKLAYFNHIEFKQNGLLVELINRHWKAIKLAGVWALADGTSEISADHMKQAIYYTEFMGKHFRYLLETLTLQPYERFVSEVINTNMSEVTVDYLIKNEYIEVGKSNVEAVVKSFISIVNSKFGGSKLLTYRDRDKPIEITDIKESNENYNLSIILFRNNETKEERKTKASKGFFYKNVSFEEISRFLANHDSAYTLFKYKGGERKDENVISETNLLVLDIDESEIDLKSLHKTFLSETKHIVTTTSNVDNKHKFRLVLPINRNIGKDKLIYKQLIKKIANEYMLKIDSMSWSRAVPYFGYKGSEVYVNSTSKVLNIDEFLTNLDTTTKSFKDVLTPKEKKESKHAMLTEFDKTFAYQLNAKVGDRSIRLYQAGMDMIKTGLTGDELEDLLTRINEELSPPLEESEFMATLVKPLRAKLGE
jgi:hypothetical protein